MAFLFSVLRILFALGLIVVTICGAVAFAMVFVVAGCVFLVGMAVLAFLLHSIPLLPV